MFACLSAALVPESRAETGITNVVNGVTTNVSTYFVGNTGPFNTLIVTNGGQVLNSAVAIIGGSPSSSNNYAVVTGAGSVWSNGNYFYVGDYGSSNRLTISNGGLVRNSSGDIGYEASSSNNAVLVTGAGSLWNNSDVLYIGVFGSGNSLTITNGGKVFDSIGAIGEQTSANNAVLVTGAGSLWSNSSRLYVGDHGSGNSLIITNGGMAISTDGMIGGSSANNMVLVTGVGSVWSNSGALYVGNVGVGNSLTITNGGLVVSGGASGIGYFGGNGNWTLVTGAGSVWSNGYNLLLVGGNGSNNSLTISNGGKVFDSSTSIGSGSGANSNWVLVSGTGSVWSNSSSLNVGNSGSGNGLTITNGGTVFDTAGTIGNNNDSSNNTVWVTGAGSVWSNSGVLTVGNAGSGNSLTIANGGLVKNAGAVVGQVGSSSNNSVLVTGAGSVWSNRSDLYLGNTGSFNQLTISNGGQAFNALAYIGGYSSSNNSVLVTSTGSVWNSSGEIFLGLGISSSSNTLGITSGGQVFSRKANIGYSYGSSNNSVLVAGADSVWRISSILTIGYYGFGNSLSITNGGQVFDYSGYIDYINSSNNSVLVAGAGSVWSNSSFMYIGNSGASNRLTISNGGQVFNSSYAYIGGGTVGSNNSVWVTGTGSVWSSSALNVGYFGSNNSLTISAGGLVQSAGASVGTAVRAGNNLVTVAGSGSTWSNSSYLDVGTLGAGNSLTVTNGGLVFDTVGTIGNNNGSSNNFVIVSGAGSMWSNSDSLYVGNVGNGNSLLIANSGTVAAASNLIIGASLTTGNVLTNAGGNLYVTNSAGSGTLDVRNGAMTFSGGQIAANYFYATNNNASATNSVFNFNSGTLTTLNGAQIVAPAGSSFIIGTTTGQTATWNMLGGTNAVTSADGNPFTTVLGNAAGATGMVTVSGAGTVWTNGGGIDVRNGRLTLNGGQIIANTFYVTNNTASTTNSVFAFTGGTLTTLNGSQIVTPKASNFIIGGTTGQTATWNILGGTNSVTPVPGNLLSVILGNVLGATGAVTVSGSGTVWTNSGTLYVGNVSAGNRLLITNGAKVFNSGFGLIGEGVFSSNNTVMVTGAGSAWAIASSLIMGDGGNGNTLTIANGGQVSDTTAFVDSASGGSNNSVVVTGTGSVWTNSGTVYVGETETGNSLTIANGGVVFDTAGMIGSNTTANNNRALVTGAGSVWSNSNSLMVGNSGSGNSLTISSGGTVFNGNSIFNGNGNIGNNVGANSNSVLVSGAGSVWSNSGSLFVGNSGVGNSLAITNGGQVFDVHGEIGNNAGANSNNVLVTGTGSVWSNIGQTIVGVGGLGNNLTITNGGAVIDSTGLVGYSSGANSNSVVVTGAGSVWANSGDLYVGYYGSSNSLTITNGGQVFNNLNGHIGYNSSASNNSVVVTGAGSVWSNRNTLYVGYNGSSNNLTISNAGTVTATNVVIGANASAGNGLTVSGGWLYATNATTSGALNVNYGSLTLNSGTATVDRFLATNGANSVVSFNGGTLVTAGSVVSNGTAFVVGNGSSSATLDLLGGSHLFNNGLLISSNATLMGLGNITDSFLTNLGTISIGASVGLAGGMTNLGNVVLGNTSAFNFDLGGTTQGLNYDFMGVTGLATLGGFLNVGFINGFESSVLASDSFTLMTASSPLLGSFANVTSGGQLTVGSFGTFDVFYTNNNLVLTDFQPLGRPQLTNWVDGTSFNANGIYVRGEASSFYALILTNGAVFINTDAFIGRQSTSSNNNAWITGAGSIWSNAASLYVGYNGSSNNLWIANDGMVVATNIVIGYGASTNNGITISGGWLYGTNGSGSGALNVNFGALTINGGTVTVDNLYVTNGANSALLFNGGALNTPWGLNSGWFRMSGGSAVIGIFTNLGTFTQSGGVFDPAFYDNAGTFQVTGGTNQDTVFLNRLGATVQQSAGEHDVNVATNFGAWTVSGTAVANLTNFINEGSLTVSGGGVLNGSVTVGNTGSFSQLSITNGGRVLGALGYLGYNTGANSNSVLVTGAGSVWSNSSAVYVGNSGSGNSLTITNGGTVFDTVGAIGKNNGSSNNFVTVSGAGSMWSNSDSLYVGDVGNGNSLLIANSGTVAAGSNLVIGASLTTGNVLTNAGGNLYVTNNAGSGTLDVRNGALNFSGGQIIANKFYVTNNTASATNSLFNFNSGTLTTLNGAGIVAPAGSNFIIGTTAGQTALWNMLGGTNAVTPVTGSTLTTILGVAPGATGVVTVSGAGTVWTNGGAMDVRNGSLTLNGGTVTVNNLIATNGANSVVTFNGGTLNTAGSTVNNGSVFQVGNGVSAATLLLNGGADSFANGLFINTNALLTGTGAITGVITNVGAISPGSSIGMITDTGSLTLLSGATMNMDLGGTNSWLYDQFNLTGALTFGGALNVLLVNGYTPQAGDRFDLFEFGTESGAFSVTNLPSLGGSLYWDTSLLYSAGVIQAAQPVSPHMLSPTPGTTLSNTNISFVWSSQAGVSQYALWVGSTPNSYDLYAISEGNNLTQTLSVPATSSLVYVRLWWFVNGGWQSNDYTYTTATPVKAAMLSPANGTTNNTASVTYTWNAGVGVSQYALWVGSTTNSYDLYALPEGTNQTQALTLPTDGRALYVRLWSLINGVWQFNDYNYRAWTPVKARLAGLANGATLGSTNVTLTWDAGQVVSQYALWVGSTTNRYGDAANSYDLYALVEGTNRTQTLLLPSNGEQLYVAVWSEINGAWSRNNYELTASRTAAVTQMISPTNGTTLSSSPVTFSWTSGTGASQYALWVGTVPGDYDLHALPTGTNLTQQLSLPLDGSPVYVRLWAMVSGTWSYVDYTYETTYGGGNAKAQMTSPARGATLSGALTTFNWSAGSGVTQYALWVGTAPGTYDLYALSEGGALSQALTLPTDGGPVYVRLWSMISGVWRYNDYFYTTLLAP